jgi:ribosomal protein L37E
MTNERTRYRCKLCGRDKFTAKQPHRCSIGFMKHAGRVARKRGMDTIWEELPALDAVKGG